MSGGLGSFAAGQNSVAGRVALKVDGKIFTQWSSAEITRDLKDITGTFRLTYSDTGRQAQAMPVDIAVPPFFEIVREGMAFELSLDGERVMTGWIDDVALEWNDGALTAEVSGRDATGDLADCAALPNGPAEFRGLDLLAIAGIVCKPFGIGVRADVDIGAAFPRLAANVHETALAFLEKAARQRAVLLVSDGVGGLLLTRGGSGNAPAPLTLPGNIQGASTRQSWRRRFSDVFVKGGTDASARRAGRTAPITPTATPPETGMTAPAAAQADEASTAVIGGHARDPEITRWRPVVRAAKTQSGAASAQAQAEWALRVARGMGSDLTYTVLDWRAGAGGALWRPNEISQVTDPYADLDKPMLIAGCTYSLSERGITTRLRVTGRSAFDRIDEPAPRVQRRIRTKGNPQIYTTGTYPIRLGGDR
jgi:prophage tail gpP-like protein